METAGAALNKPVGGMIDCFGDQRRSWLLSAGRCHRARHLRSCWRGQVDTANLLAGRLGPLVVVVPMDGFQLHDAKLARFGRLDCKGAPDTFRPEGTASTDQIVSPCAG